MDTTHTKQVIWCSSSSFGKYCASPLQYLPIMCFISKVLAKIATPFRLLSQGCHNPCCSIVIVTAAFSVLQAALLILPSLHYRASLRSTPFVPFRLHSFQPLTVHRLPMIGSPAGRCGLRFCHSFWACPQCQPSMSKTPPKPCCKQ